MAAASQDTTPPVPPAPVPPHGVTLAAWLETDIGMVREHNEDSATMVPSKGFFIVADGMGGHAAGEVASAMAVETVKVTLEGSMTEIDAFKRAPSDSGRRALVSLLQNAVLSAHQAVYQRGQAEPDKAGMGTTLDVVLIAGPEAFVAHVGDSRTYLIRDGRTSQITTDHTVAEVLVIEGKLTIEEAQVSPLRTILVNAIGVSADVGVEMAHVTLKRGDRLLLCSDGLHDYFTSEDEIAQKLSEDAPGAALKEMVELAKTRGGHDNITGVAVQILEVVDAVPDRVEPDATQPVESPLNNPFAADEPTETAFPPPPALPSKTNRPTQPMRAMTDEQLDALARHVVGRSDTLPPSLEKASPGQPGDESASLAAVLAAAAKKDTGPTTAKTDDDVTSETKPAGSKSADAAAAHEVATADTNPVIPALPDDAPKK